MLLEHSKPVREFMRRTCYESVKAGPYNTLVFSYRRRTLIYELKIYMSICSVEAYVKDHRKTLTPVLITYEEMKQLVILLDRLKGGKINE